MWEPTPEWFKLLQTMVLKRFAEASARQRQERGTLATQWAARGLHLSGTYLDVVEDRVLAIWQDAARDVLGDALSLVSDIGTPAGSLDWAETYCNNQFDAAHNGLEFALTHRSDSANGSGLTARGRQEAYRIIADMKREAEIAFGRARLRAGRDLSSAKISTPATHQTDFFISHAGEDRESFVQPLAEALKRAGRTVWYSEIEITLGDSLRGKIDEGLRNSRYGIVVLSHAFFRRPWPKSELDALANRAAIEERKVLLPIWHGLDAQAVASYSPLLAGVRGIESAKGIDTVVRAIQAACSAATE